MTLEIVLSGESSRHLLPLVTLDKCKLDAGGKTIGLLWVLWLVAGPTAATMRWLCDRVLGICSDAGAERCVVDRSDILPDLFTYLHQYYVSNPLPRQEFLFPNALGTRSWQHAWGNLLRRQLATLDYFLRWL